VEHESKARCFAGDLLKDFRVDCRVTDDAFFPDLAPACLKLGLEEREKTAAGRNNIPKPWNYLEDRNERYIHDDDVRKPGQVIPDKMPGVLFDQDDARVVPEPAINLADIDVYGIDLGRAPLEKAVRETSGRGANVGTRPTAYIQMEGVERLFEFEPTAADKGQRSLESNIRISGDELACFLQAAASTEDEAGHDQRLGFLRSFGQPAVNKELIDPFLFHVLSIIARLTQPANKKRNLNPAGKTL
jgi:hypothetical protein